MAVVQKSSKGIKTGWNPATGATETTIYCEQ